jgi:hypothetical protein
MNVNKIKKTMPHKTEFIICNAWSPLNKSEKKKQGKQRINLFRCVRFWTPLNYTNLAVFKISFCAVWMQIKHSKILLPHSQPTFYVYVLHMFFTTCFGFSEPSSGVWMQFESESVIVFIVCCAFPILFIWHWVFCLVLFIIFYASLVPRSVRYNSCSFCQISPFESALISGCYRLVLNPCNTRTHCLFIRYLHSPLLISTPLYKFLFGIQRWSSFARNN